MATISAIRDALAETFTDALPGVNVYRVPVDNVSAPAIIIAGPTVTPRSMDDGNVVLMDVYAAVSRRDVSFIDDLDALVDPAGDQSAWAAISDDNDLSGAVHSAAVVQVGEYRELVMGDVGYYAATLTIEVYS